jgi:glycosyltransferase involved in cell wall biosynthesis
VKVLFLSSLYAPYATGGAERVARTLAGSVRDAGDDVVVLTTAVVAGEPEREVDGIRVRSIALRNVYDFSGPPIALLKPLWHLMDSSNPWMRESIAAVIRSERPDVVHTHLITGFSPIAWESAASCGVPVVHTLHDQYLLCARSTMTVGTTVCEQQHLECALLSVPRIRAARRVAAVVGVSRFVLTHHQAHGAFSSARASVIPNPCHLVGAPGRDLQTSARTQPLRLGYLGRLEVRKGIELLLSEVAGLPQTGWSLVVAGSGEAEFVEALRARHASARITFAGQVDPGEFLASLDVLVVPSLVPETFGLSAAEALASGVPVVASTRGALREIIHDGTNGLLFDPSMPGALSEALGRLIRNPEEVRSLAAACRSSAEPFRPRVVAEQYREVYRSVAAAR